MAAAPLKVSCLEKKQIVTYIQTQNDPSVMRERSQFCGVSSQKYLLLNAPKLWNPIQSGGCCCCCCFIATAKGVTQSRRSFRRLK